jgi:hypothetical protein
LVRLEVVNRKRLRLAADLQDEVSLPRNQDAVRAAISRGQTRRHWWRSDVDVSGLL